MTKGKENRILKSSDRTFSPNELYFIRDYLGNIKSIFDENGEMLYYRLYDEFGGEFEGQSRSQDYTDQNDLTQPCFTPFGFTSREFDEITDLYFYRSRYYDPQIGRFTQRDKFNEAGFITGNPAVIYNPLQLNDYTYVGNNPLIYTDPWGYIYEKIWKNPKERSKHIDQAISYEKFLTHIKGKTLNDLRNERLKNKKKSKTIISLFSGKGPDSKYRYVIDPKNPNQVFDMRHFLIIGPLGEQAGLVVEIGQLPFHKDSAFDAQDFFSNKMGQDWFYKYYLPKRFYKNPEDAFYDSINRFFTDRKCEES
ncbi:MAG: RHS repeat-associated core domain-containing protein [Candidatus Muiribacteriota bacterium]